MLLFVESMLWSIIGESGFVVSSVVPSAQALLSLHMPTGKLGSRPAVLTRLEGYKLLQDAHIASIMAAMIREMALIAAKRGILLEDMTSCPIKTLSQLACDDMVVPLQHLGDQMALRAPTFKISPLHDLERGRRMEVEETLGYAVRQSTALGIPTPTMDTCYKLIAGINHYLQ